MNVTEKQKRLMVDNLDKFFALLDTVLELRLAFLKQTYPGKTEAQLIHKIHWDVIEAKERQWNLQKVPGKDN
ncbi:MAG: hypothetical protein GY757_02440 [bacterium]|nr:hypothetical protein [bacterium]